MTYALIMLAAVALLLLVVGIRAPADQEIFLEARPKVFTPAPGA